jgi:hypothetical protein
LKSGFPGVIYLDSARYAAAKHSPMVRQLPTDRRFRIKQRWISRKRRSGEIPRGYSSTEGFLFMQWIEQHQRQDEKSDASDQALYPE